MSVLVLTTHPRSVREAAEGRPHGGNWPDDAHQRLVLTSGSCLCMGSVRSTPFATATKILPEARIHASPTREYAAKLGSCADYERIGINFAGSGLNGRERCNVFRADRPLAPAERGVRFQFRGCRGPRRSIQDSRVSARRPRALPRYGWRPTLAWMVSLHM